MGAPRIDRLDKNYIINGGLDFWQRGLDLTLVEGSYFCDRFKGWAVNRAYTLGQNMRVARSTDVPDAKSQYSLSLFTINATTGHLGVSQRIESKFSRNLKGKEATLSFYVKRIATIPAGHKLQIRVASPSTTDTYGVDRDIVSEYLGPALEGYNITASTLSTSWTKITLNLSSATNADRGLVVLVWLTTDVVTGSELASTQEQIRISQFNLIEGVHEDAEFSMAGRDYAEELQLCQRYYEKSYNLEDVPGTVTLNGALAEDTSGTLGAAGQYRTRKRATPTVTLWNPDTGASNSVRYRNTISSGGAGAVNGTPTPLQTGECGYNFDGASADNFIALWHHTADAEL